MPYIYPVSYTTVGNVQTAISRIGSTGISSADTAYFIGKAEAYINARIGRLYSLPISGYYCPTLQVIAEDFSVYYVMKRLFVNASVEKEGDWLDRFKEAEDMLTAIESGNLVLLDNSYNVMQQSMPDLLPWSNTKAQGYIPTFDLRDPSKQRVDPQRLQDEADEQTGKRITEEENI